MEIGVVLVSKAEFEGERRSVGSQNALQQDLELPYNHELVITGFMFGGGKRHSALRVVV